MNIFENKSVVITGGTGSLGKVLIRRLLSGTVGTPKKIVIFSRDEAKQHFIRTEYQHKKNVMDPVISANFEKLLEFRIGDIRNYHSVCSALKGADIVVNAAALKQVPSCEYYPYEAVMTNITGAENIVRAIREHDLPIETVVGISTDKACKPVNVMGMTKAIQERIFIGANISVPGTRFICVRYGNVLASRGSVIPLFHEQIRNGGPLTITTEEMTRFLLPLERAVDTVFFAIRNALPGETIIPKVPAARIVDVAKALIGDRPLRIEITGIRPGEKIDEIMVSEEEAWRTYDKGGYYGIRPMMTELTQNVPQDAALSKEYSSGDTLMGLEEIRELLAANSLLENSADLDDDELLR